MIPFEQMHGDSRLWIYQANRLLTSDEVIELEKKLTAFIDQWTSHGAMMLSSGTIMYHRFLIIAADEAKSAASGCGIDKSVNFVKQLGQDCGIDFFNRTQVCYIVDGQLTDAPLHQFWAMRKAGNISPSTLVFDNTIRYKHQLGSGWLIPFEKSWHQEMWSR